MTIKEIEEFRDDFISEATDDNDFISNEDLLNQAMPYLLDSKLIESEDYDYTVLNSPEVRLNGYQTVEAFERIRLFVVNDDIQHVSERSVYESDFKAALKFTKYALNNNHHKLNIQESDPLMPFIVRLASDEGKDSIDVIEIYLLTSTVTVSFRGNIPKPNEMHFKDEQLKVHFQKNGKATSKDVIIKKFLIDMNFLYTVEKSKGRGKPLKVQFERNDIEVLKAADESNFESYLCVLSGTRIADLYKEYGARLLEKNVRSFLQFRGVNSGMRKTINTEPERFVAYNNGLTITAIEADIYQHKKKTYLGSLTDFQIVNGGQTTASIYFSMKDGLDVSQVRVMAKINIVKQMNEKKLDELISNISEFSNTQNRVSKVDLRARNPALIQFKKLSESIITPTGKKWFFERAKGDFRTKMRRIKGSSRNENLEKTYPKERRFSKELLAKYYSSWGDSPHLVKKGGEKIFRIFLEHIDNNENPLDINREFFENTIAKILLFRRMEKLYGQGKNSIGQLRSAVIPYSLSVIYEATDGNETSNNFNMQKVWREECFTDQFEEFLLEIMKLMNDLIKNYSASDDFGEYSKKEELWIRIKNCREIKEFMKTPQAVSTLKKYTV